MPIYVVRGTALVSVETEIRVEADNPAQAKTLSCIRFAEQGRNCIVGNSVDEMSVHGYVDGDATLLPPPKLKPVVAAKTREAALKKLTYPQKDVMRKLEDGEWHRSWDMNQQSSTCYALMRMGLIERMQVVARITGFDSTDYAWRKVKSE